MCSFQKACRVKRATIRLDMQCFLETLQWWTVHCIKSDTWADVVKICTGNPFTKYAINSILFTVTKMAWTSLYCPRLLVYQPWFVSPLIKSSHMKLQPKSRNHDAGGKKTSYMRREGSPASAKHAIYAFLCGVCVAFFCCMSAKKG